MNIKYYRANNIPLLNLLFSFYFISFLQNFQPWNVICVIGLLIVVATIVQDPINLDGWIVMDCSTAPSLFDRHRKNGSMLLLEMGNLGCLFTYLD